jgi:hypothetical protein
VTPHAAGRAFALLIAIAACGATELLSPSPALVATWDGTGGVVGEPPYSVALSIRELGDSVRGDWQIDFSSDRATDEGTFSGAMEGDELVLLLRQTDCTGEVMLRLQLLAPGALGPGSFSTLGGCVGPGGGVSRWVRHQLSPRPRVGAAPAA